MKVLEKWESLTESQKEEVRERLERAVESRDEMFGFLREAEKLLGKYVEIDLTCLDEWTFEDVGEVQEMLEHLERGMIDG